MKQINLWIVSNTTVEIYLPIFLNEAFREGGMEIDVTTFSPEQMISMQSTNPKAVDLLVVLLDIQQMFYSHYFDKNSMLMEPERDAEEIIAMFEALYGGVKQVLNAPILWFGFEDYRTMVAKVTGSTVWRQGITDVVNIAIYRKLRDEDVYVDFKRLIAESGIPNAYDRKGYYRWNSLYSKQLLTRISAEI